MSKANKSVTLRDIIDFVDLYVQENSIEANYNSLLETCKSIGVSSYTLNLLIRKVKDARKNTSENRNFDLLPVVDTVPCKKKTPPKNKTRIVYKTNNKAWGGFMCLLILIYFITMFVMKNNNARKITSARSEIRNYLMAAMDSSNVSSFRSSDWHSINKDHNSISEMKRVIRAKEGDSFSFDYEVSSEFTYDWLTVYVHRPIKSDSLILVRKSGDESGHIKYQFEKEGTYKFTFRYSKDASISKYRDKAIIKNVIWEKNQYLRLKEKVDALCNELKK